MDDREELKEKKRRLKLKRELHEELEARLAVERKKWEKTFTIDLSNSAFLTLRDAQGGEREFILVTTRKKNGVLGKALKMDLKYLMKLAKERGLSFNSWIYKITFGADPFFPFSRDQDYVTASPTFLLAQNQGYVANEIDPYNVKVAGFLFVNYPRYGNFLEAVSGSVVGNIAVIEQLMQRNNESYTRENHLQNWLYYFLSRDSRNVNLQIFNMHEKWTASFSKYLQKFKTSFK
jgi:hypothetical protein